MIRAALRASLSVSRAYLRALMIGLGALLAIGEGAVSAGRSGSGLNRGFQRPVAQEAYIFRSCRSGVGGEFWNGFFVWRDGCHPGG
jgi:hypothetical protein